jgi:SARP family transcriptional regulator, regulator of embCAB operon
LGPRIYVTGHVAIEHDGVLVGERELPGRQGRRALVYLVLRRASSVPRDHLVEAIWAHEPPAETENALSAILSKLRAALKRTRAPGAGIEMRMGAVTLRLPPDTRVDIEDAANAVDDAEGALRRGDIRIAWSHANVAVAVVRRPLLAREESPWIESERERLRALLTRGLQVLSAVTMQNGERELALQYAHEIVALEPFRETGYQQLMRMHAEMGNRGEALRVFGRLRELLRDELGTSPSPQTEAVFREILTA